MKTRQGKKDEEMTTSRYRDEMPEYGEHTRSSLLLLKCEVSEMRGFTDKVT